MEEKKQIKISLLTFFLIVSLIVIGIMGYFIYVLNQKNNELEAVNAKTNSLIQEANKKLNDALNGIN